MIVNYKGEFNSRGGREENKKRGREGRKEGKEREGKKRGFILSRL